MAKLHWCEQRPNLSAIQPIYQSANVSPEIRRRLKNISAEVYSFVIESTMRCLDEAAVPARAMVVPHRIRKNRLRL